MVEKKPNIPVWYILFGLIMGKCQLANFFSTLENSISSEFFIKNNRT